MWKMFTTTVKTTDEDGNVISTDTIVYGIALPELPSLPKFKIRSPIKFIEGEEKQLPPESE